MSDHYESDEKYESHESYEIRAIAPEALKHLRTSDDAGHAPRVVVDDEEGNTPLPCCLGRSKPHETIALVSYAPLRRWALDTGAEPGPYDELGPVFIHPDECGGRPGTGVPDGLRGERRVLRAYSAEGNILGGRLLDGPGTRIRGSPRCTSAPSSSAAFSRRRGGAEGGEAAGPRAPGRPAPQTAPGAFDASASERRHSASARRVVSGCR